VSPPLSSLVLTVSLLLAREVYAATETVLFRDSSVPGRDREERITVEGSSTDGYHGRSSRCSPVNHISMCGMMFDRQKIADIRSAQFRQLAGEFRQMRIPEGKHIVYFMKDSRFNTLAEHVQALTWLEATHPESSHNIHLARRLPGTCHWISEHKEYKSWAQDSGSGHLWIEGIPGMHPDHQIDQHLLANRWTVFRSRKVSPRRQYGAGVTKDRRRSPILFFPGRRCSNNFGGGDDGQPCRSAHRCQQWQ